MAVETAADLAGMFDEDEFAESASYVRPAGGGGITCSVIVDRGQGRQRFSGGNSETVTSERALLVRLTADGDGGLAAVERNGVFTILDASGDPTSEVFKVAGLPKCDQTARVWSADLVIGS